MTSTSIAVAFVGALLGGLIAGFSFRKLPRGETWALGCAVALGLTLLQTSVLRDLLRPLQPKVAMDWLPAVVFLAAACSVVRQGRYRWTLAITLAVLLPIRLLWGSVYMQLDSVGMPLGIAFGTWAISLAVAVGLPHRDGRERLHWNTGVWNAGSWALIFASVSISIMMSGSLTYGAASGTCGFAVLGALLSAGRIPNIAAVPLVCLIGLATAFSELSPWAAVTMLLATIGLLFSESVQATKSKVSLRTGTVAAAVLVSVVTFVQFRRDLGGGDAYGSQESFGDYGSLPMTNPSQDAPPTTIAVPDANTGSVENSPHVFDATDPFGGLGLPGEITPE